MWSIEKRGKRAYTKEVPRSTSVFWKFKLGSVTLQHKVVFSWYLMRLQQVRSVWLRISLRSRRSRWGRGVSVSPSLNFDSSISCFRSQIAMIIFVIDIFCRLETSSSSFVSTASVFFNVKSSARNLPLGCVIWSPIVSVFTGLSCSWSCR